MENEALDHKLQMQRKEYKRIFCYHGHAVEIKSL